VALESTLFDQWIFTEGLPESCPQPESRKFEKVNEFLTAWVNGKNPDERIGKEWSTHEWLQFLKNLPDTLSQEQMASLDRLGRFTASGNAEITTLWLVEAIQHEYTPAYQKLEDFLINTGRRKFLVPLYNELLKTPEGKKRAVEIYKKARPNYHFVATNTFDKIIK
jgi:hypothetical protein